MWRDWVMDGIGVHDMKLPNDQLQKKKQNTKEGWSDAQWINALTVLVEVPDLFPRNHEEALKHT